MIQGLVSVVLPIYNVEKYLDRCIESVVGQTYKNLEIILVDDESPDGCPKKCEDWAKRDKRIKVIHKENAGLGYARNTGIENATGEYFCFFDSDDYVEKDTIEKAYDISKKQDCDMALFGHYDVNAQGTIVRTYIPNTEKNLYEDSEVQNRLLPDLVSDDPKTGNTTNLWLSACFCMYSMKMISEAKWRFVSERDIISEDVYSLLLLYKHVRRVAIIPEAFYYYCENTTSLTHTYKSDRFNRIKHFYNVSVMACDELKYNRNVKERLAEPFMSNTIAAMKMAVISNEKTRKKKQNIKDIINDSTLQEVAKNLLKRKQKKTRRIFMFLITRKMYRCCYLLLKISARR